MHKTQLIRKALLFFILFIIAGCTTSPQEKKSDAVNCDRKLAIVHSSDNKVSEDGFIISFDGKDHKTLEKLLQQALKNQQAIGCKSR